MSFEQTSLRVFTGAVLTAYLAGCQPAIPSLAGGKPLRYWLEKLHANDARQRRQAVAKLGNVGLADPAVLPALIHMLHDLDPGVRRAAIGEIIKLGPDAGPARSVLDDLARRDPDGAVRHAAQQAVATMSN